MNRGFVLLLLLSLLALAVAPVAAQDDSGDDDTLNVVVTYTVLADVVRNVAGDAATVTVVMPPNADPHGYEPTPQQVAVMIDADVVFSNGVNFEEGIAEIIEAQGADINEVVASQCVPIWSFDAAAADMHDHDEEAMHDDEDMHGAADHGGAVSAAYMVIQNDSDTDVTLISAATDAASIVEIHETTVDENEVMRMRELPDGLTVPAGEQAELVPGGYHVMLIDLTRELNPGDSVTLTLAFADGQSLTVDAPVMDMMAGAPDSEALLGDDVAVRGIWVRPAGMPGMAMPQEMTEPGNLIEVLAALQIHDHDDEDHAHEGEDHGAEIAIMCDAHMAELDALTGVPDYFERTMGPLYTLDCGDGHNHEDHGDEHDADAHNHGACDPHVWMDPHNAILWTYMVRDTLSELDPMNADVYAVNATAYAGELATLAQETMDAYAAIPAEQRVLITNHRAFGYVVNPAAFSRAEAAIPGGSTLAEPSAQEFGELIALIEETGVPAIFAENTASPRLLEQLSDQTGVDVLTLFTGSLTDADGEAPTYIDLIRVNTTTITEALRGE